MKDLANMSCQKLNTHPKKSSVEEKPQEHIPSTLLNKRIVEFEHFRIANALSVDHPGFP